MQETVRIERYADQGRCVAHIDGRVVFVRFALPGELVRIELDTPFNRADRFWTGEVVEVVEPSPDRVEPVWPLAGPLAQGGGVGGADLIHVSLEGQHTWKSTTIAEQMKRLGHVDVQVPLMAMPQDESYDGLHWRTRIEMRTEDNGLPSMHKRGSHDRIIIDDMPLASRALLAVANHYHVWDRGFGPDAQIRIAVPEPRDVDTAVLSEDELLKAVGDNFAILVDDKLVEGTRELTETIDIDGKRFTYKVDAGGFWQMHRLAPVVLPQYVLHQAQEALQDNANPVIWDLYSGSGLFTLPLASSFGPETRVLSVEGARPAVEHARKNIKAAGLHNVEALCGDVAKTLAHVKPEFAHPDLVVLDPPRAGAKAKVCKQIAATGVATVIYVACDPASLARDTATFIEQGYALHAIQAFDIYPNTHHVETVAVFTR